MELFKVLVVEDNLVNQKVAVALLAKMGYQADVSGNGQEALEALDKTAYDLILMDCQMPVKDGYETTRAIRKLESPLSEIPVIAMTANAMAGDDEKCYEAGMDDYMTKPIDSKLMAEKIAVFAQQKQNVTEVNNQ
ncbi:response regulator [Hydrogenovibrio sp. 3SP14C1]|uniref:response regulator n=1 Tax=Hydrogenovibrio sp. 3SP14C1 TaxID=3038774 RepID=UPI002416BACF|nr:response regulator [Hydrogenovibrio sp. 3SP14C1]MDG4813300.1 response regulator [Hydrogenovibrio sp. 3SP14C1]